MSFYSALKTRIEEYPLKEWITDVSFRTPKLFGMVWVYDFIGEVYIKKMSSGEFVFIDENIEKFIYLIYGLNSIVGHDDQLLKEIHNFNSMFLIFHCQDQNHTYFSEFRSPKYGINMKEIFSSINMDITSDDFDKKELRHCFKEDILTLMNFYFNENEKKEYIDVVESIYSKYDL